MDYGLLGKNAKLQDTPLTVSVRMITQAGLAALVLPPLQDAAPHATSADVPTPGTSSCTKHPTAPWPRSTPSTPLPRPDRTPPDFRTSGADLLTQTEKRQPAFWRTSP